MGKITAAVLSALLTTLVLLPALSEAAVRGYRGAAPGIQQGMVVRQGVSATSTTELQPASRSNGTNVIGVTTDIPQDKKTAEEAKDVVFVESAGEVAALVSSATGDIVAGDKLTLSDRPGILTKLTDPQNGVVFATAKEAYDPARAQSLIVGDSAVMVASIMVEFGDQTQTVVDPEVGNLKQFGESVGIKEVSEMRLILAFFVIIAVLVLASVILYGAIANGLYSVGRNPLSKASILRSMFMVIGLGIIVILLGLGGVYLILTL